MAESIETIITVYKAQVEGYTKEIDAIIKKVRELTGIEDQQKQNATIGARSLIDSAAQRKKLLDDEIKNLKLLETQSKKAFNVPEIKSFTTQISQAKSNIALLSGETAGFGKLTEGLKGQFATLGAGILAAFSIQAVVNFGRASIEAFFEAQKSAKLLETAIKNVGGGDDSAVGRFIQQAEELQKITIFNDEQIQSAQTLAFQFGLTQKQVEELIPVVADFASATGQDLQTALESVLRATEGQGRGLKVYGITIKDTANRSQDLANIIDQLNGKFKGQAEVVGNTASGAFAKFKNQINELQEDVGSGLLDVFSGLIGTVDVLTGHLFGLVPAFEADSEAVVGFGKSAVEAQKDILAFQKTIETFIKTSLETKLQILIDTGGSAEEIANLRGQLKDFTNEGFKNLTLNKLTNAELLNLADSLQKVSDAANVISPELKKANDELERLQKTGASPDLINSQQAIIDSLINAPKAIQTVSSEALKQQLEDAQKGVGIQKLSSDEKLRIIKEELKNRGLAEDNSLAQLEQKLAGFKEEQKKLPLLPNTNLPVDPAESERLITAIKDTQAAIDEITGKAGEERIKKAEEVRKALIEEEKKTQDAINKLRVELAPTDEQKIILKAEIDEASLNKAEDDFRTLAKIQEDIDIAKVVALKLNAEKLNADLKALDDKRVEDLRKGADDSIKAANDARQKQLQEELKNAEDQIQVAAEIQEQIDRAKLQSFKEGSQEQFDEQKRILERQADQEIIANLGNAKKIEEIELRLQNDLADIDKQAAEARVEAFKESFSQIADAAQQLISVFNDIDDAQSEALIKNLEDQQEAQNENFDQQEEDLQKQLDKRLISQKTFESESAKLKDQRIVSEKKIADQIKAEQQKQAERAKALAVFEATLNFAKAVIMALSSVPFPGNIVASIITAALAGIQLAAVIATPVPKLAVGTKDKKESGLAIVGEQGEELVHIPSAAQVLPAPKTRKNKEIINAMFDDNLNEYISKKYVQPEIKKQKISTEKKYEILKQVYEKQAVDTYNKSVLEKYDFIKTETLNKIVNNYVNNVIETKIENLTTDKKIIDEVISKKNELTEILNQAKISFSTKNKTISEIKETVINKIVYDSKFIESINTNYVGKALEENRANLETKKQETFANNIANSFMMQKDVFVNNNAIDEAGVLSALSKHAKRYDKIFAEFQAQKIAEELNKTDFRKM